MPKAIIEIPKSKIKSLIDAAIEHGISQPEAGQINSTVFARIKYRTEQDLFNLGRSISKIKDNTIVKFRFKLTEKFIDLPIGQKLTDINYIYSISIKGSKKILYVGKTNDFSKRSDQHKRLTTWLKKMSEKGKFPDFKTLEICGESNWRSRERYYIKKLKPSLKNKTIGVKDKNTEIENLFNKGKFFKHYNQDFPNYYVVQLMDKSYYRLYQHKRSGHFYVYEGHSEDKIYLAKKTSPIYGIENFESLPEGFDIGRINTNLLPLKRLIKKQL